MKTKNLLYAILFLFVLATAQAIPCETQEVFTSALTSIVSLGIPPVLLQVDYGEVEIKRMTQPEFAFPLILCNLNIEKELAFYTNAQTGKPLPKLNINNPAKNHKATYTELRKGVVRSSIENKGEITYQLTLSAQDLKKGLHYNALETFDRFVVDEGTLVEKKDDELYIQSKAIDLGNGRLELLDDSKDVLNEFAFGPSFVAYPKKSHAGESLYAYAFEPVSEWEYPPSQNQIHLETIEADPSFLVLRSLAEEGFTQPASLTLMAKHSDQTFALPLEVYPVKNEIKNSASTPSLVLRPENLQVNQGRLTATLSSIYSLRIEGRFILFPTEQGLHIALEGGSLNLTRKQNREDSIQLSAGSVFLYKNGFVDVFGRGQLITPKETFNFSYQPLNVLQFNWEGEDLIVKSKNSFYADDDDPPSTLESERFSVYLTFDATLRQTTQGYELDPYTEFRYKTKTAIPLNLETLTIFGRARVNHELNEVQLLHSYNQDIFDDGEMELNGYRIRYSEQDLADLNENEASLNVYFDDDEIREESSGENSYIKVEKGRFKTVQGRFTLKKIGDRVRYESLHSNFKATWFLPTLEGAPTLFQFQTEEDGEDFLDLRSGDNELIFSQRDGIIGYKKIKLDEQDELEEPLLVEALQDGNSATQIYFTKDNGLYLVKDHEQILVDFTGRSDKEYFANPNYWFNRIYGATPRGFTSSITGDLLWGYPTRDWVRVDGDKILLDIGPLYHLVQFYKQQYNTDVNLYLLFKELTDVLIPLHQRSSAGFGSSETEGKNTEQGFRLIYQIKQKLESEPQTTQLEWDSNPSQIKAFTQALSELGVWYDYELEDKKKASIEQERSNTPDSTVTSLTPSMSLAAYAGAEDPVPTCQIQNANNQFIGYHCSNNDQSSIAIAEEQPPSETCEAQDINTLLQNRWPLVVGDGYYPVYRYPLSTQHIQEKNTGLLAYSSTLWEKEQGHLKSAEAWKAGAVVLLPVGRADQGDLMYRYYPSNHPKHVEGYGDEIWQNGKIEWEEVPIECVKWLSYTPHSDETLRSVAKELYGDPALAEELLLFNEQRLPQGFMINDVLPLGAQLLFNENLYFLNLRKLSNQALRKAQSYRAEHVIDTTGLASAETKRKLDREVDKDTTVLILSPHEDEGPYLERIQTPNYVTARLDPHERKKIIDLGYGKQTSEVRSCGDAEIGNRHVALPFFLDQTPVGSYDYTLMSGEKMNVPVPAPFAGEITLASTSPTYGNLVEIQGTTTWRFAHLQELHVKSGDTIKEGDSLGIQGSTGRSTGPHVHTEIWTAPESQGGSRIEDRSQTQPIIEAYLDSYENGGVNGCLLNEVCDQERGVCVSKCEREKGVEGYMCSCNQARCEELGEACALNLCPGERYCCAESIQENDLAQDALTTHDILVEETDSATPSDLKEALAGLPALPEKTAVPIPDQTQIATQALSTAMSSLQQDPNNVDVQHQVLELTLERMQQEKAKDPSITDQRIQETEEYLLQLFNRENAVSELSKQVILYGRQASSYEQLTQNLEQEKAAYTGNANNPLSSKYTSITSWIDSLVHDSKSFNPERERSFTAARIGTLACLEKDVPLTEIATQRGSLSCAQNPEIGFEDKEARLSVAPQEITSALNIDFEKDPVLLTLKEAQQSTDQGKLYSEAQRAEFLYQYVKNQHTSNEPTVVADALLTTDIFFRHYSRDACDLSKSDWSSVERSVLEKTTRKMCIKQEELIANLQNYDPYYKQGWYQCAVNVLDLKWFAVGFGLGKIAQLSKVAGGAIVGAAVVLTGHQMMGIKGVTRDEDVAVICSFAGSFGVGMVGTALGRAGAKVIVQESGSIFSRISFRNMGSFFSFLSEEVRFKPSPAFNEFFSKRIIDKAPEKLREILNRIFKQGERTAEESSAGSAQPLREPPVQVPPITMSNILGKPLFKNNPQIKIVEFFKMEARRVVQDAGKTTSATELFFRTSDGAVYTVKLFGKDIRILRVAEARVVVGDLRYPARQIGSVSDEALAFFRDNFARLKAQRFTSKLPDEVAALSYETPVGVSPVLITRRIWEESVTSGERSFDLLRSLRRKNPAISNKLEQITDDIYATIYELIQQLDDPLKSPQVRPLLEEFALHGEIGITRPKPGINLELGELRLLKSLLQEGKRLIHADNCNNPTCIEIFAQFDKSWRGTEIPRLQAFVNTFLEGARSKPETLEAARLALSRIADRIGAVRGDPIPKRTVAEILEEFHKVPCTPVAA